MTGKDFWGEIEGETVNNLLDVLARYPDAIGMAVFHSQEISISGPRPIYVPFGPSNTAKNLADAQGMKPTWRHAFVDFIPIEEVIEHKPSPFVKTRPKALIIKGGLPEPTSKMIQETNKMKGRLVGKPSITVVRPVQVGLFGKTSHGIFIVSENTHERDRFVEEGIVPDHTPFPTFQIEVAGGEPKKKGIYHWDHGMDYGVGVNPSLAEWGVGGYYDGSPNEYHPVGSSFCLTQYIPMNFGSYKDQLVDEDRQRPFKRYNLLVRYLDA